MRGPFHALSRIARAAALLLAGAGATWAMQGGVDWERFLEPHDMAWKRFPGHWHECLFLGNGTLGASLYQDADRQPAWFINRTDHVVARSRYPVGRMSLKAPSAITGADARLDLWNAEGRGLIRYEKGATEWRSFVSARHDVIVIDYKTEGTGEARWEWKPAAPIPPVNEYRRTPVPEGERHPAPVAEERDGISLGIQNYTSGEVYVVAWKQVPLIKSAGRRLLVALKTGTDAERVKKSAQDAIRGAEADGGQLERDHRQWWHDWYPRSFISIPDKRLEAFYWIQIYKFGSGMRPDSHILDLQGPWFYRTRWPRIWWNLNVQMTYYPLMTANRADMAESLFKALDAHRDALAANAGKFNVDSAVIGRSSSYDLVCPFEFVTTGVCEPGNLLWTLHVYWLYYRHTMDDELLERRLLPLLERAVRFYIHHLERGADGRLHIPPTTSPEYDSLTPSPDTTYDLALLRWGCLGLLESYKRLGRESALAGEARKVLAGLADYATDRNGWMVARGIPFAKSHRHHSHLFPFYPLLIVNPDQPENREIIKTSVGHWLSMPERFVGFSFPTAGSLMAHLGDGARAEGHLQTLLNDFINPNTFCQEKADGLATIETPLAFNTTLQEMLLQSWGGRVRVFPAVPPAWEDAVFADLLAEGAFVVSAERKKGRTEWIEIESRKGEPLALRTDLARPWKITAVREPEIVSAGAGEYLIDLRKGERVRLSRADVAPQTAVAPVGGQAAPKRFGQGSLPRRFQIERTARAKSP